MTRLKLGKVRSALVMGGLALSATSVSAGHLKSITMGSFSMTDAAVERGMDLSGRAMMIRGDDKTEAFVQVLGLPAGTYKTHVHNLPCDVKAGGGHYMHDLAGAVDDENEIWPFVTTDGTGVSVGMGSASVDYVARPEAQSVVVHDTDGARLACANLNWDHDGALLSTGSISAFPAAAGLGHGDISGRAQMMRSNNRTYVTVNVKGLADGEYSTHVHNLPCNVNAGGGHYMDDPDGAVDDMNEIWPTVSVEAGVGYGEADVAYIARPEAQSVVIHATAQGGARIACANLYTGRPWMLTRGKPVTTANGIAKGYLIGGYATMARVPQGTTTVTVYASGLKKGTEYKTHVHNLPCSLGGGSHYMQDVEGPVDDVNEIWPTLKANGKGVAHTKVKASYLARPEAQSIVIHDPEDSSRLACYDLD